MQKLILLSVVLVTFAIPASLSHAAGRERYGAVLAPFAAFVAVYVVLLLFVYPHLF